MRGTMNMDAIGRLYGKALDDLNRQDQQIHDLGMVNEDLKARLDWSEKHPVKVSENHYLGRFYWPATAYCEAATPCT